MKTRIPNRLLLFVPVFVLVVSLEHLDAAGQITFSRTGDNLVSTGAAPKVPNNAPGPFRVPSWAATLKAPNSPCFNLSPLGTKNISESNINTGDCYEPGATKTLCFQVYNASPDGDWLDFVRLTFPTLLGAWTVSCDTQDPTDNLGHTVNLNCSTAVNEVYYFDNDADGIGEIASSAS